jgi:hypothetical protein
MKRVAGLRGRYTVKFSDTEFPIPSDLLSVLEKCGMQGFDTTLGKEGEMKYLNMYPVDKETGSFYTIYEGKTRIPRAIKGYLGIKKNGIIVGLFNKLELWGPESWKSYIKHEKKIGAYDVSTPDIEKKI